MIGEFNLFIDDSGNKEYKSDNHLYGRNTCSRHFVLGGVLMTNDATTQLSDRIIDVKRRHFGTDNVEVKSSWLRHPKAKQEHYLDPFGITDNALIAFVEDWYAAVLSTDLLFIAAVVDKIHMDEKYRERKHYPMGVAYDCLIQRVQQEIGRRGIVNVTMDDMTGKSPAGNNHKDMLARQHRRFVRNGSSLLAGMRFDCLGPRLRFMSSAVSHMVQVADIAAYNVFRQFTDYGEEWEQGLDSLPTYEYFRRLSQKFRMGPNGEISGYGVVKFPKLIGHHWVQRRGR